MKHLLFTITLGLILTACVPLKKYQDLEANYNKCQEEQTAFKSSSLDYENRVKELDTQLGLLKKSIETMVNDSVNLGNEFRMLQVEYDKIGEINKILEDKYTGLQNKGSAESAKLINDLEGTRIELQRKEDRLNELEKELNARSRVLDEKQKKIQDLRNSI